eukprot:scaffold645_cov247-Pinguiococcus_pyrenoidosus.AAC.15
MDLNRISPADAEVQRPEQTALQGGSYGERRRNRLRGPVCQRVKGGRGREDLCVVLVVGLDAAVLHDGRDLGVVDVANTNLDGVVGYQAAAAGVGYPEDHEKDGEVLKVQGSQQRQATVAGVNREVVRNAPAERRLGSHDFVQQAARVQARRCGRKVAVHGVKEVAVERRCGRLLAETDGIVQNPRRLEQVIHQQRQRGVAAAVGGSHAVHITVRAATLKVQHDRGVGLSRQDTSGGVESDRVFRLRVIDGFEEVDKVVQHFIQHVAVQLVLVRVHLKHRQCRQRRAPIDVEDGGAEGSPVRVAGSEGQVDLPLQVELKVCDGPGQGCASALVVKGSGVATFGLGDSIVAHESHGRRVRNPKNVGTKRGVGHSRVGRNDCADRRIESALFVDNEAVRGAWTSRQYQCITRGLQVDDDINMSSTPKATAVRNAYDHLVGHVARW